MRRIAAHPFSGSEVGVILEDALDTSGKMIRPRLLLLCAAFGSDWRAQRERLCTLAAMVELSHLASLIHDDIIDDADQRRGRASLQSRYGKDAAVYAGDYLMARLQYFQAAEGLNRPAAILSQAIQGMCAGEIGQALCRYRVDTTLSQYLANIRGKTVELFQAACRIGAIEGGCSEEEIRLLERFGQSLGTLFQLRDDLLDFTADPAQLGKTTHKDFRDGIYTMPVLCALRAPEGRRELLPLMEKNAREPLSPAELARAGELVFSLGGVAATQEEIHRCRQTLDGLLEQLPQAPCTHLLRELVQKLAI